MGWKLVRNITVFGAVAFMGWAGEAFAMQGNTPYLPGVSVGIPIGALPPPGVYFSFDDVIINGGLKNGSGNDVPVNVNANLAIPSVLWTPTWQPLQFMNATIAFDAVEPYTQQSFGPVGTTAGGFFNTIIGANVSWNFAPIFVKAGLGIYLNDGDWTGGIANNTWTFEPDVAVSFLSGGWDFTGHLVFDFQTEDDHAHYQSGDILFFDWTAGKSFGKWTAGVGGNFTQQFSNDSADHFNPNCGGAASCNSVIAIPGVRSAGNKLNKVLVGPFMGYNFGPVEVNAKALIGVHAENGFNASFYHLGVSFPF